MRRAFVLGLAFGLAGSALMWSAVEVTDWPLLVAGLPGFLLGWQLCAWAVLTWLGERGW